MNAKALAERLEGLIAEKMGRDVVVLDLQGTGAITDYFIIVTGSSPPHLKALAEDTCVALKREGVACFRKSGESDGGWIVLDYVDVVVHIFTAEKRDYYKLEALWLEAPRSA
jgi:ribosome-associated protein